MSEREALERTREFIAGVDLLGQDAERSCEWRDKVLADVDAALAAAPSDTGERCEAVDDFGGIAPSARCDRPAGHAGDHEAGWRDHAWANREEEA